VPAEPPPYPDWSRADRSAGDAPPGVPSAQVRNMPMSCPPNFPATTATYTGGMFQPLHPAPLQTLQPPPLQTFQVSTGYPTTFTGRPAPVPEEHVFFPQPAVRPLSTFQVGPRPVDLAPSPTYMTMPTPVLPAPVLPKPMPAASAADAAPRTNIKYSYTVATAPSTKSAPVSAH
jgi:hypothetical protein